ncbi:hypothetical protein P8452_49607 [Trifolium repens]|nr:hypothetical protein P8452_49607 [Trifolium repens]
MAEKKTMRDYIIGNQERTAPKRKTLGEYFIESKLDAIKRQLEALASSFCDHCYLDGHESEECPTRNLWDDCEIVHNEDQHDLHPPNWDINYIPPCLRRTCPKQAEEPNINETRTTLRQSTITELFQRYQDSISTHIQPNFESKAEVNLLTSGVDLKLRHEGQVLIESEEALTEESTCEEQHKQDMVVVDIEKSKESPFILGQTILTIGDVVIEVHKGKAPMEKSSILQNFCIVADCFYLETLRSRWLGTYTVAKVFSHGALEVSNYYTTSKVNRQCAKHYEEGLLQVIYVACLNESFFREVTFTLSHLFTFVPS